jgi:hypothetical protein
MGSLEHGREEHTLSPEKADIATSQGRPRRDALLTNFTAGAELPVVLIHLWSMPGHSFRSGEAPSMRLVGWRLQG